MDKTLRPGQILTFMLLDIRIKQRDKLFPLKFGLWVFDLQNDFAKGELF